MLHTVHTNGRSEGHLLGKEGMHKLLFLLLGERATATQCIPSENIYFLLPLILYRQCFIVLNILCNGSLIAER